LRRYTLGPDGDGFPRAGSTAQNKLDFHDQLLMLGSAVNGGTDNLGGKMDLRRFKRQLKAFCGGKKKA
jgi:hypothetical protein